MMQYDIESIASQFVLQGRLIDTQPFGSGHINDTFNLRCQTDAGEESYILQRINHQVFRNPAAMMENIRRVTTHIRRKLRDQEDKLARRQLTVIETNDGAACFEDNQGNFWRVYNRIEQALTYDTLESPEMAYEVARMFGWFQRMLIDLPGPPLHETIPDFHATPKRLKTFQEVLQRDPCNRAKDTPAEIEFVLENAEICDVLLNLVGEGKIPVRIAHNDAKINNVMLDARTHKGVCVIDLDTVMPGLSMYDFGDLVRTATSPTEEDERDLSKVAMQISTFEMLAKGFAEETHAFLTPAEKKYLTFSAKLITFEQMIRFLADYLAGDIYYKVHRERQNLDRSRTQMKLVQSIIEQEEAMNDVVESVFRRIDAP
jgi:Ser/Thr protein kinase RdoA (MazF antagonist)